MKKFTRGAVEGSTIVIILLSIILVAVGAFSVWSFMAYSEAKSNIKTKIESAKIEAIKDAEDKAEEKYAEREKEPYLEFNAEPGVGKFSFRYPKTWSSYIQDKGANGKDYRAFLHPVTVPPVPQNSREQERFALRFYVYNAPLDVVLKEFEKPIANKELSTKSTLANGKTATQVEGDFPNIHNRNDRIRGKAYYFRLNDKVIMLKTDSEAYYKDFDKLVQTVDCPECRS